VTFLRSCPILQSMQDFKPKELRKIVENGETFIIFNIEELQYHLPVIMGLDPGLDGKGYVLPFNNFIADKLSGFFKSSPEDPEKILVKVRLIEKPAGRKDLPTLIDYSTVKDYFEDYLQKYIEVKHLGLVTTAKPEYDKKIRKEMEIPVDEIVSYDNDKTQQFYGMTVTLRDKDNRPYQRIVKIGTTDNIIVRLRQHRAEFEVLKKKGHVINYEFAFFTTQRSYPHLNEKTFKANCPSLVYSGTDPIPFVEQAFHTQKTTGKELEVLVGDEARILLDSLNKFHDNPESIGEYLITRFQKQEIPAIWDNLIGHLDVSIKNSKVFVAPQKTDDHTLTRKVAALFAGIKAPAGFAKNAKITSVRMKAELLEKAMTKPNLRKLWQSMSFARNDRKKRLFNSVHKFRRNFQPWGKSYHKSWLMENKNVLDESWSQTL
jgi:hypothetical protein